jgi:ring-1,2-phenylacetyl-CoA epoxidase subunit PaaE
MSIHFHSLKVKDLQRETADAVSVEFDIPDNLKDAFQFKQGQSLTMRIILDGEEVRRTYSICSSPLDNEWRVAIKRQEAGLFSGFANTQLKKGDLLEVMQPVGTFYTALDPLQKKNYIAFAAGSGITPVLSIIKTTLRTEPRSAFTLVYGNRNKNSIIFKEALEAIKDKYMDRFRLINVLSRERTDAEINSGRIDREKCDALFAKLIDISTCDEFFICGPESMIFTIKEYLQSRQVEDNKIHFELFTTPGQDIQRKKKIQEPKDDQGGKSRVTVKLDGISFDFDLGFNGLPILDAALREGADLPYACKGGVCCTCKAKLLEGEVEMDVHWGLEEAELKQGFILTCQSHPTTEKVVIDFDIK